MKQISFSPFPVFTTKRLVLRQLEATDALAISVLRSDERVNEYIQRPKQKSMGDAQDFIKKRNEDIALNNSLYWAICLKGSPELIGTICLWNFTVDKTAEIGYELSPAFFGQGMMSEALECVVQYSFQTLGFNKLEAFTHKDNVRSIRMLERHHFKIEPDRKDEENIDYLIYSRIPLLVQKD